MKLDVTLILPIYNEAKTIPELWRQLENVLLTLHLSWEVIFIDDGSYDSSIDLLREIHSQYSNVKIISLSRNFGHAPALTAGIDHAQGRAVILMDSDLQDSPEAIPVFIKKWQEGYDVVYAIRKNRKEGYLKRLAFKLFYFVQTRLSETRIPTDAGIFSLIDSKVIKALKSMPERNKYLSGLRAFAGFRQTGITVVRGARFSGDPRVSLLMQIKSAYNGVFSFSAIPLRIVSFIGLVVSMISFFVGFVAFISRYIFGHQILSWQFGLTTISFISGIQLLAIGVSGEYLTRIYDEVKQRPYYIIGKRIGFVEVET
jgi:dolichol-phosphate mannosyltransferase